MATVRSVAAHPHAWAQCRDWLHRNVPLAAHVPASSNTASAAALAAVLQGRTGTAPPPPASGPLGQAALAAIAKDVGFDAALVPPAAVDHYGLDPLAAGVADNPDAVTRFVLLGPPGQTPPPTGADKTTLQVHLPAERAGALLEMLEHFATRGINLTRIESRPSGVALGRYSFSIDAEGHVADARLAEAMVGLHRFSPLVRYLGSYPMADSVPSPPKQGTSDADFAAAQAWVAAVARGQAV